MVSSCQERKLPSSVNTFDKAALAATREALLRAGSLSSLSAHTNVRVAFLTAYVSGMTVASEEHLRAINDYLRRTISNR